MGPDVLEQLIGDGFAVVPVLRGEKRPEHMGWQKRTFTPNDFTADHNVGAKCGKPSGHKVDVDLDAPEAVAASTWLPTTRVHGRPGKPNSHHWYVCPDLKSTVQFKDPVGGAMIVELRGTGGQTVVPPSYHPTGEILAWENRHPFLEITAAQLQRTVAELATVALLARHWPTGGSRHLAALHVGGFLARLGIPVAQVERLVSRAAEIAGDPEVRDRARAGRESAEKIERGEPATGAPHLADAFTHGALLVQTIYGWFGRPGQDQIEALNERHFVAMLGARMAVCEEKEDGVLFQTFLSFKERYCNQFIGKQSLGDVWLKSPKRREYEQVVFAPPEARWRAGPRDYNLWRGFAVAPDPAPHPERRCARYLEHCHRVIAAGNAIHGEYVLDLMANVVQHPGRLVGKTLCLRGPQGVGKSVFVEPFGWLFGKRHFIIVNSREQLIGQFNGHLSSRVVVFADEAVWGGHKQDEGTLKRLVTQDTVTIRRLYQEAVTEPNCVHLFMATNEGWPFPAGNLERRLVVLDVAGQQSEAYYHALWDEIKTPGFHAALLATLLARYVDEDNLRRGLDTKALAEVKQLSASPVQQWWHQLLEDGQIAPDHAWPTFIATKALYTQYCDDMGHRRAGVALRGTQHAFSRQIQSLLPNHPKSKQQRDGMRVERGYPLPTLDRCRQHFDFVTGSSHDWPRDDD